MRKTTILGIMLLLTALAMPMASAANATLYLNPQHSSVPGFCNNTTVELWLDIPAGMQVSYGQFGIDYTPACGNIVARNFNTDIMTGVDPTWSFWNSPPLYNGCWDDDTEWIVFKFWLTKTGPIQVLIGNFTIHGNSTNYCTNNLNFSDMLPGCSQGGITLWDASSVEVPVNVTNGTFTCGTPVGPSADLIVDRIDPRFIFANMNNSLFVNVTNQGSVASGDFDVCTTITDDWGVVLNTSVVRFASLDPGESTCTGCADCQSNGFLDWWTPDTVENITINVTVDCTFMVDEGSGESNNTKLDYRNTTGDCINDDMLPDTCYNLSGQNPLGNSDIYNGTGKVIYTYGDSEYGKNIANFSIGGLTPDTNQVDGGTAEIPTAGIKEAVLYVIYSWRSNAGTTPDPTGDFEMSLDGGSTLTADRYYTDWKGFSPNYAYHQYGTIVYNVTGDVIAKRNGDYQAVRSNYASGKGSVNAMVLMIVYDHGCATYQIVDGYDRIASVYWYGYSSRPKRMEYYVDDMDATTFAKLTDFDPDTACPDGVDLFTVAVDTTDGTGTESQKVNDCDWYAGAWSKHAGSYLSFNRSDVTGCISPSGADEVVYFREGWQCSSNGFGALFACLTTDGKKKSVHTAPSAAIQGNATFCTDKGCIENLTALNKGDVTPSLPGSAMFPYGLFSFNVTCLEPGATVNVTIELPGNDDAPPSYMKYNYTSGEWDDKVPITVNGNVTTVTLTDGGHYDRDLAADGQITDPGGPLGGAVQVSIDPCPAYVYLGGNVTVNITLSGITDYGSGTITLSCEPCCGDSAYATIESVGPGDSSGIMPSGSGSNTVTISAWNTDGLSGDVIFATVTLEPVGDPGDCICLNLSVDTLYDRNYTALQWVEVNCTCCPQSGGLHIIEDDEPWITSPVATPAVILSDTWPIRGRKPGTNVTNLSVHVTDATSVEGVWVNLTPILGAGHNMDPMNGPNGSMAGDWYWETNASYSSLTPYCLNVMAKDYYGTWNNGSCIPLEVQRRGDVVGGGGADADNSVTGKDYLRIAKWTVGLDPEPNALRGNVVPAESWNGMDMADALYIAMHVVTPGYPAP